MQLNYTMNLMKIFIIITITNAIVTSRNFILNQSRIDKSVILSEIITNYLTKYFSGDDIFVSIIYPSFKEQRSHFRHDLFDNLFNTSASTKFAHSLSDELDSSIRDHRQAFNLILIDEHEALQ